MGQWAMPKQILLAVTVHHLAGSADIITILNRYGHCQSYSHILELETAMGNSAIAHNSILPPSISTEHNSVIHLFWDNVDLNEETPSGAGITHTAQNYGMFEGASTRSPNACLRNGYRHHLDIKKGMLIASLNINGL